MLQTEFVRNLNCNYERILLDKRPEENRYQYCIVTRGGIRGLLPCSLRYINGQAYLYYDISSTQSVAQLHTGKSIGRQWVKDFLWGMRRIRQEMGRFLLDDSNLLWHPEQIYQDLEKNEFYFLYVPYYDGENDFGKLMDYLAEHIDYEDRTLVDCVYKMHEQYAALGDVYLYEQIFEDGEQLEVSEEKASGEVENEKAVDNKATGTDASIQRAEREQKTDKEAKKGIRYFLEGKLKRQKEERGGVRYQTNQMMGYAVCEDTEYTNSAREYAQVQEQEEIGRTMYVEEYKNEQANYCRLFDGAGREMLKLDQQTTILGKKKEESDCVLDHSSVSRMHARITEEKDGFYLEDLNSTNGTYKNGLRLLPYEKRKLEKEDEIRLGKVVLYFR